MIISVNLFLSSDDTTVDGGVKCISVCVWKRHFFSTSCRKRCKIQPYCCCGSLIENRR